MPGSDRSPLLLRGAERDPSEKDKSEFFTRPEHEPAPLG